MHSYHPGHACMHSLLLAFDSAKHSHWYVRRRVCSERVGVRTLYVRVVWRLAARRDLGQGAKEMCVGTLMYTPHISTQCPLISWGICSGLGQWQQVLSQAQKYHQGNHAA